MSARLAQSAVLVALATLATPASANPADAFGFGGRGPGMGGAQTAAAEDGSANYYNGAILATFDDIHLDIGYQYARPTLLVNGLDLEVNSSQGLVASLSVPGQVAGRRVAFGGGLFLPDERLSRVRTPAADQPRFQLYDNRPQRLVLAANLAVEITPQLFVSAGIAYLSSTFGNIYLTGRVGFPNAEESDMALAIDVDLKTIRYAKAGVLYRLRPWLDLGLAFRDSFVLTLDQAFVINGDVGPEGGAVVVEDGYFRLHSVSQDLFQPLLLSAGLSARLSRRWLLAFDVAYYRWSEFANPSATIALDMDIGDFNDLVDIPDSPPLPEPNFHDILVPRLGLEWLASSTTSRDYLVRAGYSYEPSPVPEQVSESNFIDNDKHTFSLGGSITMRNFSEILPLPVSFDAYLAVTMLSEREHRKMSAIDRVGDYRSDGYVIQSGVLSRWRF